jgi:hydrogenase-4 membrane subunit HyfE
MDTRHLRLLAYLNAVFAALALAAGFLYTGRTLFALCIPVFSTSMVLLGRIHQTRAPQGQTKQ